jgi:hypothetical protein
MDDEPEVSRRIVKFEAKAWRDDWGAGLRAVADECRALPDGGVRLWRVCERELSFLLRAGRVLGIDFLAPREQRRLQSYRWPETDADKQLEIGLTRQVEVHLKLCKAARIASEQAVNEGVDGNQRIIAAIIEAWDEAIVHTVFENMSAPQGPDDLRNQSALTSAGWASARMRRSYPRRKAAMATDSPTASEERDAAWLDRVLSAVLLAWERQPTKMLRRAIAKIVEGDAPRDQAYLTEPVQSDDAADPGALIDDALAAKGSLLTPREREAIELLRQEVPTREIAARMHVTRRRVEQLIRSACKRLAS